MSPGARLSSLMNKRNTSRSPLSLSPEDAEEEKKLLARLDRERLPRHVGIIMDGNGRWAQLHGFRERVKGHEAGIESVRSATRFAGSVGIESLTLYAFSRENWNRPQTEIRALMHFLETFLYREVEELNSNNVQLIASGSLSDLPNGCLKALDHAQNATRGNSGLILNLALSYGGRTEIVDAVRRIGQAIQRGELQPDEISEQTLHEHLYHPELGDPDLIIRTSGEFRISNFLLWQAAYSEFYITPVLWPDFRKRHFLEALIAYQSRNRRFGGI